MFALQINKVGVQSICTVKNIFQKKLFFNNNPYITF